MLIIFSPYKIMITTNYKTSYFRFNFERKSTYCLFLHRQGYMQTRSNSCYKSLFGYAINCSCIDWWYQIIDNKLHYALLRIIESFQWKNNDANNIQIFIWGRSTILFHDFAQCLIQALPPRYKWLFNVTTGGFSNEIKTKIWYLMICCYHNFILFWF